MRSRILLKALRSLDGLLQRLVPTRSNRLAWVSDPDYIGNAFHLYRHALTSRPDLEHVWLVGNAEARSRILADLDHFAEAVAPGATVRVVDRHTPRGYWSALRSRRILHTHGAFPVTTSAHRRHVVSLWHGMPIKCIGALNTISPNPHPTFGTLHLATSDMFRYVIAAAFRTTVDRVLVCGLPRCDVLAEPHGLAPSPTDIRQALGIPPGRRVVLWTPTYRASAGGSPGLAPSFLDDLDHEQWQAVDELAGRHQCTVVVKLHPHDVLDATSFDLGLDHVRVVGARDWLATGIELYDALAVTDALISDVSSVLIDYLATTRPIGIIGFDPATYTRDVVFPVSALLTSSRIHDLSQDGAMADFFAKVEAGTPVAAQDDDLSAWLYDVGAGGCEAVLQAIGL